MRQSGQNKTAEELRSAYLGEFAAKYAINDVLRYLKNAQPLKVLVIGEAIIDEYQYCEAMGKSGKEPILAVRYISTEQFAGGILAVANHAAAFCDRVDMLTFLGAEDSQEGFIRGALNSRVQPMFLFMDDAPTIVKRRFIESYPLQKMFEIYVMGDTDENHANSHVLCARLREVLPEYDLVIVTDYGHGMLGPEAVDILCEQANFLAVNTQLNAANHGFNTISKYSHADYISVSETEIRLEARSRHMDIREIVSKIADKLTCGRVTITQGQAGCLCYDEANGFCEVPALTTQAVDRMGAGDAFLVASALCTVQNAPVEIVGFVGNAVGALAIATVGNRTAVEREPLFDYIESFFKSTHQVE